MIWMHDVEAKNQPKRSGECLLLRSAFKSLIVQAVDYPAYAMVICQHSDIKDVNNICWLIHGNLQSYRQVKTSIVICSAIFDGRAKMTVIFVSFGSLALAFCQLQIRHRDVVNAVRPHLFEWIIECISINCRLREKERERERERWSLCVPACSVCASLSTNNYFKNSNFITSLQGNIM